MIACNKIKTMEFAFHLCSSKIGCMMFYSCNVTYPINNSSANCYVVKSGYKCRAFARGRLHVIVDLSESVAAR